MLILKKNINPNYLMSIVKIDNISPIKNSDNLVKITINGGMEAQIEGFLCTRSKTT